MKLLLGLRLGELLLLEALLRLPVGSDRRSELLRLRGATERGGRSSNVGRTHSRRGAPAIWRCEHWRGRHWRLASPHPGWCRCKPPRLRLRLWLRQLGLPDGLVGLQV